MQETFVHFSQVSRFEKKRDFIVSIAFLRLKNTIATKKKIGLPRGNMSISQETNPQENHIFKPAHPQMTRSLQDRYSSSTHSVADLINHLQNLIIKSKSFKFLIQSSSNRDQPRLVVPSCLVVWFTITARTVVPHRRSRFRNLSLHYYSYSYINDSEYHQLLRVRHSHCMLLFGSDHHTTIIESKKTHLS